jgi:Flp pilus assembly pilin Flp
MSFARALHSIQAQQISPTSVACGTRSSLPKGGESIVTFSDLVAYLRARFGVEEGQTMAEYGVILAVITVAVVTALGLLSGAIGHALDTVRGYL